MLISLINHDEPFADIPIWCHFIIVWIERTTCLTSLPDTKAVLLPPTQRVPETADANSSHLCPCMSMWHLEMELGSVFQGSACNSYTGIHPCRLRHEPHRRAWSLSFGAIVWAWDGLEKNHPSSRLSSRCEFLAEYLWKEIMNIHSVWYSAIQRTDPPNEYWLMQMLRQPIR